MDPTLTRRCLRATLAFSLVVGLAGPAGAQAADPPDDPLVFAPRGLTQDRFPAATTAEVVEVTAHDGVVLSSRVYRPDTSSDPAWKTPVILVHSPYYGTAASPGTRSIDLVQRFTPKGYTVVLSSVRGTGDSGGCLEQDGPNQAKDFKTLVEHFAAEPWSNGKVASYGKSYDAETQNAGAVLRPDGLETMVTVAGISSLYDVGYFDGVPTMLGGLEASAFYATTGPGVVPTERARYAQRVGCYPDVYSNSLDPTGDETNFWAERNFRYGVENVEASVLYVHGLNDFTVNPLAIDGWYDELPGFKRAIFGQWGHFYPYDAPNTWARDDWYGTVHAWLDHELLGLDTGVEAWPPVQVQDEANTWRAVESFAGMGVERALPLGSPDVLGQAGPEGATVTYGERTPVSFDGPVLDHALHLSGQAFLDATIAFDRPDAHIAVTLQEVPAGGSARTLTRGYLSVQHQEDPNRGHEITPGHPVPYRIRTFPFDKTIAAESRLRLTLNGSDNSTRPAANGYTGTVFVDGRSVLRVPVVEQVCGVSVDTRVDPAPPAPCVDQKIPEETARYEPDAARGHVATHRTIGSATETVGGAAAVREWGYLTVRDGVELAFEVVRPADGDAHPVLLTYDGYNAGRNPDPGYAARYLPRGYALVGLNVRGTGCSGGVFDFFQPSEGPDGFEMVEWIARQPWSTGSVGMIGKSYPGITQLFVAESRPPHLAAISPGHYYADVYRDVAFPGGILNYAFASLWSFIAQPGPGVQAAPGDISSGDQTCARNLDKHARNARTNPFVQAQEHPYADPLVANRSPEPDFDRIEVPVYTALAWQDEQLSSRQSHSLRLFEELGVDYRAVLSNGDHNMYRTGAQLAELDRFLEAHVEGREVLRDGTPVDHYLAEPAVTIFWEQGGAEPRWRTALPGWGDQAEPRVLYTRGAGQLSPDAPPPATVATAQYTHSAAGSQGVANPKYASGSLPDNYLWDDVVPSDRASLTFTSEPFAEDTVLLGSASADLWITATAPNVDLQVTLTEVRPDGQEVYVQQGWLRTKQRATDPHASTRLLPVQTHQVEDVQPLSTSEPSLARVEVFPFGHVVRAGSRIRMWIEAPTVIPQLWGFALDPTPARVDVWQTAAYPSRLVLPVANGIDIPEAARSQPTCGQPIRQPCRPDPRAG